MREISSFFDKFKNIALKELQKREIIASAIQKVTKQAIDLKDISIKDGIVSIKAGQNLKSEIFIKKQSILKILIENKLKISDVK